jgi:hypothetical protein
VIGRCSVRGTGAHSAAVALAIVFLMSVKPGPVGSLLAVGVALALGLALRGPGRRRNRVAAAAG